MDHGISPNFRGVKIQKNIWKFHHLVIRLKLTSLHLVSLTSPVFLLTSQGLFLETNSIQILFWQVRLCLSVPSFRMEIASMSIYVESFKFENHPLPKRSEPTLSQLNEAHDLSSNLHGMGVFSMVFFLLKPKFLHQFLTTLGCQQISHVTISQGSSSSA